MSGRVKIKIAGHEYVMCAEETEEYMNAVGALAQQVITQCGGSDTYGSTRALILSSINLADQTMKAQQEAAQYRQKCKEYETQLGIADTEIETLQEESATMDSLQTDEAIESEAELEAKQEDDSLAGQLRAAQEKLKTLEKEKKSLQGELSRSRSRNNKRK